MVKESIKKSNEEYYNIKLFLLGIAIVGIWRGSWMIMDYFLGEKVWTAFFTLTIGIIILYNLDGGYINFG